MGYAATIIEKFGGTRPTASAIEARPSTVQSWKDAGYIPSQWHSKILVKAREMNVPIGPEDFFDPDVLAGRVGST